MIAMFGEQVNPGGHFHSSIQDLVVPGTQEKGALTN